MLNLVRQHLTGVVLDHRPLMHDPVFGAEPAIRQGAHDAAADRRLVAIHTSEERAEVEKFPVA